MSDATVPPQAIVAAAAAVLAERGLVSDGSQKWALRIVTTALEAAAPHFTTTPPGEERQ